jgi:hypothetical protein
MATSLNLKFVCVMLLSILVLTLSSCKDDSTRSKVKQLEVSFKKDGELQLKTSTSNALLAALDIEIADTDYTTQTGLMYRTSMPNNQGMLFIFPDTAYRSFYMKNTAIALDIIFIAEDQTIINIQKNAQPMDESSLTSDQPAKYVLEVNAGLCDQWGVTEDDHIAYQRMN